MFLRPVHAASLLGLTLFPSALGCGDSGQSTPQGGAGAPANGGQPSGAAGQPPVAGAGRGGSGGPSAGGTAGPGSAGASTGGSMTSSGGSGAGGATAGSGGQSAGMGGSAGGSAGQSGATNGGATGGHAGTSNAGAGGSSAGAPGASKTFVYVGTGDWGKAAGGRVRVYSLDETALSLSPVENTNSGTVPSYVTVAPNGQSLYAADEEEGKLGAFSIDRATGRLTALNSQTGAGNPVYLSMDGGGKFLLSAYYNQGTVEVFSVSADRRLGTSAGTRQTGNQSHSIVLSPDNAFAFVPNKGANNISQFRFDAATGALTPNTPATVPATGGPRHLKFHPSKPFAYVVNETGNSIRAYSYDASSGTLTQVDEKSTLPPGFSGNSSGADVHVEPTGKYVYASNRASADSTIAIFSTDAADGKLTLVAHEPTRGSTPRAFAVHPSGRALLVANQDSSSVATFRLDPSTGRLTFVQSTDVGDKAWTLAFLVVAE